MWVKIRNIENYYDMNNLFDNPPLLILGMHRSGTTLLVEILMKLGYFSGANLEENLESEFILKLNEWILRRSGGAWDNPLPIKSLIKSNYLRDEVINILNNEIHSERFSEYYKYNSKIKINAKNPPIFWGWKDPRNIFTLNLWLEIFPQLKILIIRRNGIDVANSLHQRQLNYLKNDTRGPFIIKPLKKRIKDSINQFERFNMQSCRCTTMEGCFNLWEEYQFEADDIYDQFSGQKLYISYENLLLKTENVIEQIKNLLCRNIVNTELQNIQNLVNSQRAFAFIQRNNLHSFYNEVKETNLMKKYGYDDLL